MNVLVTGGAGSGKSAYAEGLACSLSTQRRYLATMSAEGAEAQARIERHRRQRAKGNFETVECAGTLPTGDYAGVVLLDDLGNLVAQALFAPDGSMADEQEVLARLDAEVGRLFLHADHVVVVGNETGAEGRSPYEGTQVWVRLVGSLACRIAARADAVVEVVAGIPYPIKGAIA
ncbi:MAG: bifunctional adenosylcobinamide kinase/adenosylcobinamide-phosphate guanylyltransferase [Atopobiaceae bacterium]|nr:bifunctional adenosylcobinamide kinase/adenosylcobinamide-phosphate guanylyltransferase [Atopobiaceae bacterium]